MKHLKESLRKEKLAQRDSLDQNQISSFSAEIMKNLFNRPRFIESRSVAFYISKRNEVDTFPMIEGALRLKKEVLVPVTEHSISFFKYISKEDLCPGKYGILEPKTKILPSREPDIIIVPGISFGLCMHRLGYGKGYYDRYLSTSPAYRIGVCFDFQVVEKLPSHENDERMDEIITDKRIIPL